MIVKVKTGLFSSLVLWHPTLNINLWLQCGHFYFSLQQEFEMLLAWNQPFGFLSFAATAQNCVCCRCQTSLKNSVNIFCLVCWQSVSTLGHFFFKAVASSCILKESCGMWFFQTQTESKYKPQENQPSHKCVWVVMHLLQDLVRCWDVLGVYTSVWPHR